MGKKICVCLFMISFVTCLFAQSVVVSRQDESNSLYSEYDTIQNYKMDSTYMSSWAINKEYTYYQKKSEKGLGSTGIARTDGSIILPNLFLVEPYYENRHGEGICKLCLGYKYGIYDCNKQKWIIPVAYQGLNHIVNGIYSAYRNGLYGIINSNDSVILPFLYSRIIKNTNNDSPLVIVTDGEKDGIFDVVKNIFVLPCAYERFKYQIKGDTYSTKKGSNTYSIVFTQDSFKMTPLSAITNTTIKNKVTDNKKAVSNNKTYKTKEKCQYVAGTYTNTYLIKTLSDKYKITLDTSITDQSPEYDTIYFQRYNEYATVKKVNKFGLVKIRTSMAEEILPPENDTIYALYKDCFAVKKGNYFYMYNAPKNTKSDTIFIEFERTLKRDFPFIAMTVKGYVFIDEEGKIVSSDIYKSVYRNNDFKCELYVAQKPNGKFCFVDKTGTETTATLFDDILDCRCGLHIVKFNGRAALYSTIDNLFLIENYDNIVFIDSCYVGFIGKQINIISIKDGIVKIRPTMSTILTKQ